MTIVSKCGSFSMLLAVSLLVGCAPRAAYLATDSAGLPGTVHSMHATACQGCGAIDSCRCRPLLPSWKRWMNRLACAGGCGDIYWGDWRSDPPRPCDDCMVHRGATRRRNYVESMDASIESSLPFAEDTVILERKAAVVQEALPEPVWKSKNWSGRHSDIVELDH